LVPASAALLLALVVPSAIARTAYVVNDDGESVSVINTATNTASPTTIKVGNVPADIAITPDGKTAYVTNNGAESVSVINTATNTASPTTIKVGKEPLAIAISPDGKTAYVTNDGADSVSVIDTATNTASPTTIKVGREPLAIAITPDGKTAYVTNRGADSVSVINTATNTASPMTIKVGSRPFGIAITPDQSALATFSVQTTRARPGVPVSLDASASKDPDGTVAAFSWGFGDGQSQSLTAPTALHTYANPGTYSATLALIDNEGCSGSLIFTGQTASCSGSPPATVMVKVAYPGVKVHCPKGAKPKGCSFKLQVVAKKPKKGKKAKPESAVAKAKLKAGKSAIVSLKPSKAFRAKLAAASSILVKETIVAGHATKTRVAKLKVVQ
jgi:YVTN family beta-propeller protein